MEKEHKYIRDDHSTAIINSDIDGLEAYKKQRNHSNKISNLENDINNVRNELLEIKQMLQHIIQNRG